MKAWFFDWHTHPALNMGNDIIGTICVKCAQREAGKDYIKELINDRQNCTSIKKRKEYSYGTTGSKKMSI